MTEDAKAHIEEAYRLLTSEAYRGPSLDKMTEIDGFCGVAADLERIDGAIGPRGQSIFGAMAATIAAAYVEIKAARAALGKDRADD